MNHYPSEKDQMGAPEGRQTRAHEWKKPLEGKTNLHRIKRGLISSKPAEGSGEANAALSSPPNLFTAQQLHPEGDLKEEKNSTYFHFATDFMYTCLI